MLGSRFSAVVSRPLGQQLRHGHAEFPPEIKVIAAYLLRVLFTQCPVVQGLLPAAPGERPKP